MFDKLKRVWQEAKDASDAKWDAEHTIKMTPIFENEHETTQVNLSSEIIDKCHECGKPKPVALVINSDISAMTQYQNWKSSGTKMCLKCYTKKGQSCSPPPSAGIIALGTPIDDEIAPLIAEMNRVGIHTTCLCQGHDGEAYVAIRLGEGTTYEHHKDIFGPSKDELVLRWRRR